MKHPMRQRLILLLILLYPALSGRAQSLLEQPVSLDIEGQTAVSLLEQISRKTNILFSYNSDIVKPYTQISLHVKSKPVKQILDQAFAGNMHYKERGKYIILLEGGEKSFVISGYIENGRTGEKISNATVYESQMLASALTDDRGYFRLPIRNRERLKTLSLTIRKEAFTELSLNLNAGYDQELVLPIVPQSEVMLEDVVIHKQKVESTWVSRFFLSSKQQVQALNLGGFMARRPIQTSILPGIGTHGIIGAQVINKFSLNMLGGYTAGVNGVEIGGLFNINKNNVQAVQVAGVFNNVGGNVGGVQIGGVYNNVIGSYSGVQIAGVINRNKDRLRGVQIAGCTNWVQSDMKGVQVSGVNNHVHGRVKGVQLSGVLNTADTAVKGIQLSALANISRRHFTGVMVTGMANVVKGRGRGLQMAGLLNRASRLKGMQIGLINIADTLDGYSLGLVNYSRSGKHQFLLSANEIQSINLGYCSGSDRLYSVLSIGSGIDPDKRSWSVGYGIGTTLFNSGKWSLNTTLMAQSYYIGDWSSVTGAGRVQVILIYRPHPLIGIFAGPAYTVASVQEQTQHSDYLTRITEQISTTHNLGNGFSGWIGWQAGITVF